MSGIGLGQGRATAETARALRVSLQEGGVHWLPKSIVHDDSEVYELGHAGKVVVEEWWADANGFSAAGKRDKR